MDSGSVNVIVSGSEDVVVSCSINCSSVSTSSVMVSTGNVVSEGVTAGVVGPEELSILAS